MQSQGTQVTGNSNIQTTQDMMMNVFSISKTCEAALPRQASKELTAPQELRKYAQQIQVHTPGPPI